MAKFVQLDRSEIVGVKAFVVRNALVVLVLYEVQLDRIEADDLQLGPAFVTGYVIALLALGLNENFFTAFWTN